MTPSVHPHRRLWFGLGILVLALIVWGTTRFYYNRYELKAPINATTRSVMAVARPYFTHITHTSRRIVWTRTASESQPAGAPWHRDWLITITGSARNPWGLRPLTLEVYVNGQDGGIDAWSIPLSHPVH